MLTITDIAKKLGVSHSTVSRALNDSPLISIETKDRIRKVADEYGFALNSQAQSLKTHKTGTVGILFPRYFKNLTTNIFYAYVYDLLQAELLQFDLDIMVIYDYRDNISLTPLERIIQKRKVDGYIILQPDLREREFKMLVENKIPHVSLFRWQKTIKTDHNFLIDSEYGGYIAGDFFCAQQDVQLFYLGLQEHTVDNTPRIKGFMQGTSDAGYTKDIIQIHSEMSLKGGYDGIMQNKAYFTGQFKNCAMYAYNDMMAIGAINALHKLSVDIPRQVQIIGTDDIPLASWLRPTLSTVQAPAKELIKQACNALYKSLCGEILEHQNVTYKPTLIHRETTLI